MKATVLGASGFIGRNLVRHLSSAGYEVTTPGRDDLEHLGGQLGRVFYCIGMTGNFRDRPLDTVDVHAGLPGRLLERVEFESFVYFSSTRIYAGAEETSETTPIAVTPSADTTYDLSKMLGEALCLSDDRQSVKVIRLSNVYGPDQGTATFLGSLLEDLAAAGHTTIREAAGSSKDYVAVADVADLAERIARSGSHRTYNVASGRPVRHDEIAEAVRSEGLSCTFTPGGILRAFPPINIERIRTEFGFSPRSLLQDLPALLRAAGGNAAKSRVDP